MKFLIGLSWKNLSRYRKRTAITASAIAIGLAMYILMDGMLQGAELESTRNLIWYETGSAKIMTEAYYDNMNRFPLGDAIKSPGPLLQNVRGMDVAATPRAVFTGELILNRDPFPEDGSMNVRITAIDPTTDDTVFHLRSLVSEGRYLEPGDTGILMGAWLAEDLGARVGYTLTIVTRGKGGFYQTIDTKIVGLVNSPNPVVNRSAVLMSLDVANEYLAMDGSVTEIDMGFPLNTNVDRRVREIAGQIGIRTYHTGSGIESISNVDATSKAARSPGGDLTMVSWRDLAKDYLSIAVAKRSGSSMILFLVFIIAAVGVSNTMLMTIFERTREMGMMRAMGMLDKEIRTAFLLEATGIGLIGSVGGVILGSIANIFMVTYGINFGFMMRHMDMGYRIATIMRSAWNPQVILIAFFAGTIMSGLVAFFPTRRALKMSITDCLRDV